MRFRERQQQGAPDFSDFPALQDFVIKWNTNDECANYLLSVPREVALSVIKEYDPRPDVGDISNHLRIFTKSSLENFKREKQKRPRKDQVEKVPEGPPDLSKHPELEHFIASWDLNDELAHYLLRLPDSGKRRLIDRFDPSGHEAFVTIGLDIRRFARKLLVELGEADGSPGPPDLSEHPKLEDFVIRWSVNSGVTRYILGLKPDIMNLVIEEFRPPQDTEDVNGRLKVFARTVLERIEAGGSSTRRPKKDGKKEADDGVWRPPVGPPPGVAPLPPGFLPPPHFPMHHPSPWHPPPPPPHWGPPGPPGAPPPPPPPHLFPPGHLPPPPHLIPPASHWGAIPTSSGPARPTSSAAYANEVDENEDDQRYNHDGEGPYGEEAYGEGEYGEGAYGEGAYGEGAYGEGAYGEGAYGDGRSSRSLGRDSRGRELSVGRQRSRHPSRERSRSTRVRRRRRRHAR
eukprot:TRINITY_DN7015_c1_g1_i1.p1 TRINITY_DN7015_c1_g1~~TRINITY_DN7015_c1_g1_i1.p1  ORF type:complete len:458 (+),score=83.12 TRINITY_DN7015_c1_g1_i1:541-1914(+)